MPQSKTKVLFVFLVVLLTYKCNIELFICGVVVKFILVQNIIGYKNRIIILLESS